MYSQTQVKVTLPLPLKDLLEEKAIQLGLTLSGYIRHLVVSDVKETAYPVYFPSKTSERAYKESLISEKKGKLIKLEDFDPIFKSS